jgi:hypothetical protein
VRRLAVIGLLGLVVVVLGVAQLVLPGIAAQRIRDELARNGRVESVSVSAFPAIELLWHQADTVRVRLASYASAPSALGPKLSQSSDVGTLQVSTGVFTTGLLTVHDATLVKQGGQLTASGFVGEADLRRALPILESVTPVASSGGQVILRGTASVFGASISADATLGAQDGDLILSGLGGLASIRVFHAAGVDVLGVSATPVAGGFDLSGRARVG